MPAAVLLLLLLSFTQAAAATAWSLPYYEPPATVPGRTFDVGPGQPLHEISEVPWLTLAAGDMVRIHARATPYVGIVGLKVQATAAAPVRIYGVRDPVSGAIPVISANGAAAGPNLTGFYSAGVRGLGCFTIFGGYSVMPCYIQIANLEIRDTTVGATYSDAVGTGTWGEFVAGIWARAKHLAIRGCRFSNNGLGVFTQSNDPNNALISEDVLIEGCDFSGNGVVGRDGEHNIYTQGIASTIQFCRIGQLRSGANGSTLKDRSAGTIIRYNRIAASSRAIDLVEPEESPGAVALSTYGEDYVYGNIITNDPAHGGCTNLIHYGADNRPQNARRRTLHFYNNSVSIVAGYLGLHDPEESWRANLFQITTPASGNPAGRVEAHNNILSQTLPTTARPWSPCALNVLGENAGTVDFRGGNWIRTNWTSFAEDYPTPPSVGRVVQTVALITGTGTGYVNNASDLSLAAGSPCRGIAVALPASLASYPVAYQCTAPALARTGHADSGALESSAADTTAPSVPGSLTATVNSATRITLAWTASTDNVAVAGYRIFRGGTQIATATGTTYSDTGLTASTAYAYAVAAYDTASPANVSARSATVNATTQANHAPVATAQSVSTAEDTAKAITLAGTDADGQALTFAIVANPTHGTLSGSGASRTYTPAANYTGADSFTFKANDGALDSPAATVSLTVTAVNDPPVATAQSVTTAQDTAKAITLAGTDVDGSALTFAIATNPAHGSLSGSGASRTYTPAAGYSGSDSFTFTVNDGTVSSSAATVTITVTAVASTAPVVSAASAAPSPVTGTTANLSATATDNGGEAALLYTWSATGPAAVAFSPNGSNAAKASVATFRKAGSYTLTVTAKDAAGLTGTKTVALTVNATPTRLSVSPTGASVQPMKTVDFNATAEDQFGAALAPQPTLTWTVSGGGTIDANGLFTAGAGLLSPSGGIVATTYVVTASGGSQSATSLVTVSAASTATPGAGGCGGGAAGLIIGLGMMLGLRRRR